MTKIIAYDIEASGLKADFGFLLCAAFGDVNTDEVTLLSLSQFGKGNPLSYEKKLVQAVAEEISKADVLVSYYGKGFDRPFLNAKMLEYGLPVLPNIPEIDLYFTVKSNLAISRKSLQNVAYYAKVENEKTPVEGRLWKAAQMGNKTALRAIEAHNIADVKVLRDVYMQLRPLVRQHPRINSGATGLCKYGCTGGKLQKRGLYISKNKNPQQRIQCRECGGWDLVPIENA